MTPLSRLLLRISAALCCGLGGFTLSSLALAADATNGKNDWKLETVHLKSGKSFPGLIDKETPALIRFQYVNRKPGQRTLVIHTTFARDEVARLTRLERDERERLRAKLQALDPTGKGERQWMEVLDVKSAPWGSEGKKGWSYASDYFVLRSDAEETLVRQAAVRLEQIYTAYTRFLPPRHPAAAPTTILLAQSTAEYQALLKEQGRALFRNPAFYDPTRNQIVCASDLQQLGHELDQVRQLHGQVFADLKKRDLEVAKLPKGDLQERLRKETADARQRLDAVEKNNQRVYDRAGQRFYQTLYHEAFHAYLANFVYPAGETAVPRWLNEGLAQIFETAIVEADELRVGHAEESRLARVKLALRKNELVPVAALARADAKDFLVAHASDQQVSDRFYSTSWALAFHLTFELRRLGTPAMDAYVRASRDGKDPLLALAELTGQKSPQFERAFHEYLQVLQSDGTTSRSLRQK